MSNIFWKVGCKELFSLLLFPSDSSKICSYCLRKKEEEEKEEEDNSDRSFLFSIDPILLTSSMAINQAGSGFLILKYISANR